MRNCRKSLENFHETLARKFINEFGGKVWSTSTKYLVRCFSQEWNITRDTLDFPQAMMYNWRVEGGCDRTRSGRYSGLDERYEIMPIITTRRNNCGIECVRLTWRRPYYYYRSGYFTSRRSSSCSCNLALARRKLVSREILRDYDMRMRERVYVHERNETGGQIALRQNCERR